MPWEGLKYQEERKMRDSDSVELFHMVMYDINRLCAQEQDKLDRALAEHHMWRILEKTCGTYRKCWTLFHLNEYIQAAKNEEIEVYLDVSVPRELFVTAMVLWHGTPGPGRLRAYGQIPIGCLF